MEQGNIREETEGSEGMSPSRSSQRTGGCRGHAHRGGGAGPAGTGQEWGEAVHGAGRGRQQAVRLERVTEVRAQRAGPRGQRERLRFHSGRL